MYRRKAAEGIRCKFFYQGEFLPKEKVQKEIARYKSKAMDHALEILPDGVAILDIGPDKELPQALEIGLEEALNSVFNGHALPWTVAITAPTTALDLTSSWEFESHDMTYIPQFPLPLEFNHELDCSLGDDS
jgi:hypothetical protein